MSVVGPPEGSYRVVEEIRELRRSRARGKIHKTADEIEKARRFGLRVEAILDCQDDLRDAFLGQLGIAEIERDLQRPDIANGSVYGIRPGHAWAAIRRCTVNRGRPSGEFKICSDSRPGTEVGTGLMTQEPQEIREAGHGGRR